MKARFLPFLVALVFSSFFASPAHAECIDDSEEYAGWYLDTQLPMTIAADGALVLTAYFEGNVEVLPQVEAEVSVTDAEGATVPGTLEVFRPESRPRLVWRPDVTLEPGQNLTMEFSQGFGTMTHTIDVVESLELPEVTITELRRLEIEAVAERRCCDIDPSVDFCDNPCESGCERCGIEEYTYPIMANVRADMSAAAGNDLFVVEFEVLKTDETSFENGSSRIDYPTRGSFSAYGVTIPDDVEGFCASYKILNDLTGEVVESDSHCSEDVSLSPASRNEPESLDTSVCVGDTLRVISQDGTVEQVPIDGPGAGGAGDAGVKEETGGCSTGSGGPSGLLLLLAGLGFVVRRRR